MHLFAYNNLSFKGKQTIQEMSGLIIAPPPFLLVIYIIARSDSLTDSKLVFKIN